MDDGYKKDIERNKDNYNKMTSEEIKQHLKGKKLQSSSRLDFCYVRVRILLDYINVLNNHFDELKEPANVVLKDKKFNILNEYILLEICSFYQLIYNENILKRFIPTYFKVIKDFRNKIVAHMDKDMKLSSTDDWIKKY